VASDFLDLVRRSQLVEDDQLTRFLGTLTGPGGQLPEENEQLAAAMVSAGLLTDWQADKLLAGKHKGFMLGKYKLLRHLGKGGMSQVYLAEHVLMRRKVAIKVLPSNRVEDSTYLERFRIEARAAAKLDDPNIVRVYDIDNDGKTHYIVMEYVDGLDLHQLVKEKGPLPYEQAADFIAQVARGLAHAHEMGLVHRDIKPANCMVTKNDVVKLLDMGLARLIDDEASLTLENNENVLGTADYLAPEQALNSHKADTRADIYSLGCTFYFLLTGHPPFPEGAISERLLKHQMEQAPSIFKDRPDAPHVLVNICNRMMAKKPEDRYQTAGEITDRLAEWLGDRGITVGETSKRSSTAGSGSGGLGSDVFRRFAAMSKAGGDSVGRQPGNSSIHRATPPPTRREPAEPEVELELAPFDDEPLARAIKTPSTKPAAAGSTKPTEKQPAAVQSNTTATATPAPPKPLRSLIEEELEVGGGLHSAPIPQRRKEGDFDPLRPPGFSGPTYGTPGWVWALVAGGVVVLIVVALFLAFR
jgi:serine/threonine protein kinase